MQGININSSEFNKYILRRAILNGTDFSNANLSGSNLQQSEMRGVILSNAILCGADLSDADLSGANLRRADLRGSILFGTDLSDANLSGVDLNGADVRSAKFIRCQGLKPEVREDLKQRGAILEDLVNPPPPPSERRKWWIQIVVVPLAIPLIGSLGLIGAQWWSNQNRVSPTHTETQKFYQFPPKTGK